MTYEVDPLYELAVDTANRVKEAGINVGRQMVVPYQPGSAGAGMMDPNPGMAYHSQLNNNRSEANYSNYTDGQVSGTNLIPYSEQLNQLDQSIAFSTDPNRMTSQKAASGDPEAFDDALANELADSGLFQEFVPPDAETWDLLEDTAREKAASDTVEIIEGMLENGYLQEVMPEIIDYL